MRDDSIGLFWEDIPQARERGMVIRPQPPIPDTGWRTPTHFPDLSRAKVISLDTETKDPELLEHGPGWGRGKGHVIGISIGADNDGKWYFPIRHEIEPEYNMDPQAVFAWLRHMLSNPHQAKIGANLMYDVGWLAEEGVPVVGTLYDVQLAEALLSERGDVNLDWLGEKYLGMGKETSLLYRWCADFYGGEPNGKQRANLWRAPARLVGPYAEMDAVLPLQIMNKQWPLLAEQGLLEVFEMENGLIPLLIAMRRAGVSVDIPKAEALREKLILMQQASQAKLDHMAGGPVSVNSGEQVARAFDAVGVKYPRTAPTEKKPEGNPSFTRLWLEQCTHPLAEQIKEIRRVDKLRGTFVESYILNSHVNGKVYGQFHLLRGDDNGTRSGRLSSSTPNLQNIPSRDKELAPLVRGMFIPDAGHKQWRRFDYCVAPDMRVLTADLRHVPAKDIKKGDLLIGFDEDAQYTGATGVKARRMLHKTKVKAVKRLTRPVYRITTDRGQVDCSDLHRWLARKGYSASYKWMTTVDLKPGMLIPRLCGTWETEDNYDAGWLAGIFDGEGWYSKQHSTGFAQKNDSHVLNRAKQLLRARGFTLDENDCTSEGIKQIRIAGGRSETWRLLGSLRPGRLINRFQELVEGLCTQSQSNSADVVRSVEYLGEQEVVAIETEHKTLVVEGLLSHNSQIEYRFLVHFAVGPGSNEARAIYHNDPDTDYHEFVINMIDRMTGYHLDRKPAKNINFGLIYGMGIPKLLRTLGLDKATGDKLFKAYHEALPYAKATMESTAEEAMRTGVIQTIMGRRSRFELWEPRQKFGAAKRIALPYHVAIREYGSVQRAATHKSLNRRLQGSAADMMKMAMWRCWKEGVYDYTGLPRVTVHDEKGFSDQGGRDDAFAYMKHVMENAIPLRLPVRVDEEMGPDWGHVE